jgi:putative addiction module killer protein
MEKTVYMYTIVQSEEFVKWLSKLKSPDGKGLVLSAIKKAERGNFGDHGSVGGGVFEIRIHSGPGYRLYYTQTDGVVYFMLVGGTKKQQQRDIDNAIAMAQAMKG